MTFKSTRTLPQRSGQLLRTSMYAAIGAALLAPGVSLAQQAQQAPQQPQQQQEQKEPQRDEATTLDAVTVSSDYIPEPLLQSPSVISVVTQADLERSGDSTAAQALTRVSGLSVVGDKFVYVRGLGERYSSALFNGSPLPSPEPLQRVVPLDLFPSEALAGMTVQKTYSVRYPGEFGGGVIDLQGLTVPEKPFAKLTFDIGGNSVTTGSKGLTHYGSDRDWWGYDDGRRDLPDAVIHSGQLINYPNQSRDELRALGREMNDPNLYLLQQKNHIDPDLSFGGSAGTAFDVGEETKLGVIGVLNFENKWRTRTGKQQIGFYAGDELGELNQDYDFSTTRDSARVNGLFGLGLKGERHSIAWSTLYVHDTVKESKSRHGFDFNATGDVRDDGTLWLERELVNNQLSGKSAFGEYSDVELEWRLGQAETTRKTPFETGVRYIDRNGSWAFSRYDMRFGAVEDEVKSAGVDVAWHLPTERSLTLSGGLAWSDNDRSSVLRSFQFVPTGSLSVFNQFQRIEYLLSDWNIQNDLVELRETSPNNSGESAFDGKLEIRAAYAQLEGEIAPNWRGSLGIRYEDAEQSVTPLDLFSGEPATGAFNVAPLENDYLLPALSLTWNLADNQQIRFGASKTIARPQFREMAPQQYTDPDNDRLFYGNPFLVDSELTNLDLRYEWFFERGRVLHRRRVPQDHRQPGGSRGQRDRRRAVGAELRECAGSDPVRPRTGFQEVLRRRLPGRMAGGRTAVRRRQLHLVEVRGERRRGRHRAPRHVPGRAGAGVAVRARRRPDAGPERAHRQRPVRHRKRAGQVAGHPDRQLRERAHQRARPGRRHRSATGLHGRPGHHGGFRVAQGVRLLLRLGLVQALAEIHRAQPAGHRAQGVPGAWRQPRRPVHLRSRRELEPEPDAGLLRAFPAASATRARRHCRRARVVPALRQRMCPRPSNRHKTAASLAHCGNASFRNPSCAWRIS